MPHGNNKSREHREKYRTGQTNAKGQPICGAQLRKREQKCGSIVLMANGRCRLHGGESPGGLASPHLKDGRYSRFLPVRLAANYEAARADPDRLSMADELALLDSRLGELLARLDSGEAGQVWQSLSKAYADFRSASDDPAKAALALGEIGRLITRGQADYAAWEEIASLIEQRRKLAESEQKRMVAAQQVLTAEQALLLIGRIGSIIRERVSDRGILAGLEADFARVLSSGPETRVIDSAPIRQDE